MSIPAAAGSVVTCLSSIASQFGEYNIHYLYSHCHNYAIIITGEGDEKGKVMGIFRSLGALARAVGPVTACTGKGTISPAVVRNKLSLWSPYFQSFGVGGRVCCTWWGRG